MDREPDPLGGGRTGPPGIEAASPAHWEVAARRPAMSGGLLSADCFMARARRTRLRDCSRRLAQPEVTPETGGFSRRGLLAVQDGRWDDEWDDWMMRRQDDGWQEDDGRTICRWNDGVVMYDDGMVG